MPRGWHTLHYSKICSAAEWSPYGMNFPGDKDAWGGGCGGVSYRSYTGSSGTFGPQGTVFVNPHLVHAQRTGLDIGYNAPGGQFNALGQLSVKDVKGTKSATLTTNVNVEHESGDMDSSLLLRCDTDLGALASPPAVMEVGARAARGDVQANFRTKIGVDGSLGPTVFVVPMPPQLEVAARVAPGVRAGALLQLGSRLAARVSADRDGWLWAATGELPAKGSGKRAVTLSAVTPKRGILGGVWCKLSAQVKAYDEDVKTVERDRYGTERTDWSRSFGGHLAAVAEVGGLGPASLKVKAETKDLISSRDPPPTAALPQLSASIVVGDLPGGHTAAIGVTKPAGGKLQCGATVYSGFYGFCGW